MPQNGITIREIARMCGVSTQTVSRVINDRHDVSPETRAAVQAAIASVGFRPSAVARSLVHRRSRMLGVVATGLRYFGVAQTLNGITEASEARGYALLLKELADSDVDDLTSVIDFFIAHRVEGIIVAAPELGSRIAAITIPPGSPPIIYLKSQPVPGAAAIVIDNVDGARQAVDHLVRLGRRRIGHLSGPLGWPEARDRRDGWLATVQAAGLQPGPMASGDWSAASGETAFTEMLSMTTDVDAIFAANDQMALGILYAAHQRGIRIPDDIAVVGFDGLEEAERFTPSLTTVAQPVRRLGQLAVSGLLAMIDEEPGATPAVTTLEAGLIIRESAPEPITRAGPAPR